MRIPVGLRLLAERAGLQEELRHRRLGHGRWRRWHLTIERGLGASLVDLRRFFRCDRRARRLGLLASGGRITSDSGSRV